jgi:hypothetical protein
VPTMDPGLFEMPEEAAPAPFSFATPELSRMLQSDDENERTIANLIQNGASRSQVYGALADAGVTVPTRDFNDPNYATANAMGEGRTLYDIADLALDEQNNLAIAQNEYGMGAGGAGGGAGGGSQGGRGLIPPALYALQKMGLPNPNDQWTPENIDLGTEAPGYVQSLGILSDPREDAVRRMERELRGARAGLDRFPLNEYTRPLAEEAERSARGEVGGMLDQLNPFGGLKPRPRITDPIAHDFGGDDDEATNLGMASINRWLTPEQRGEPLNFGNRGGAQRNPLERRVDDEGFENWLQGTPKGSVNLRGPVDLISSGGSPAPSRGITGSVRLRSPGAYDAIEDAIAATQSRLARNARKPTGRDYGDIGAGELGGVQSGHDAAVQRWNRATTPAPERARRNTERVRNRPGYRSRPEGARERDEYRTKQGAVRRAQQRLNATRPSGEAVRRAEEYMRFRQAREMNDQGRTPFVDAMRARMLMMPQPRW